MNDKRLWQSIVISAIVVLVSTWTLADERTESFDKDPGWDGRNHRSKAFSRKTVRQDFGYSRTHHARGKKAGEIGGFIHPAAEPAYYARRIPTRTLEQKLTAAGTIRCTGRQFHVLLGFFNAQTLNEWRTPNTVVLRLYGRGKVFYAYLEYATSKWRAGGDHPRPFSRPPDKKSSRSAPIEFPAGVALQWSLQYDAAGNGGRGVVTATLNGKTAVCNLADGHRKDGASFNRFGLMPVMKHYDTGGELWLDDITINGTTEHFDKDPKWDEWNNRRRYVTGSVRPRFDFGFSGTRFAGGKRSGELGGLVFRGDCREADRMAYYGDRLHRLTLRQPLRASGKVALRRGVSDSTTLIGFFHSTQSMAVSKSQSSGIPRNFLGIAVEGPSREGFYFYPLYRVNGDGQGHAAGNKAPHILPDGKSHAWTLAYSPAAGNGQGGITVSLDGKSVSLDLGSGHRRIGVVFDRFGIITTWIDGNGQHVYFDDLSYTWKQTVP
jgi:hypothetical protein